MPLLQSACQVCGPQSGVAPDSLFKCSRCQAVLYCGRAHQSAHYAAHKSICRKIKKKRDEMEEEADKIRNATEDAFMPANAFETHVGHFWGLFETRSYMRAKFAVITELSTIDSQIAIETALAEAMDSLRLCRGDNVGIREVVPTLMLLLGQYQETYDFFKWYATSGSDSHYDWGNMELPFLDIHGADMTEDLSQFRSKYGSLFHLSSLVYIKMMLAKGVKDAINAHELADRASLPALVTDSLRTYLLPQGQTQSLSDLKSLHVKLTSQIREAFSLTHTLNKHFWSAMLDPSPLLQAPEPEYYADGDANQVKLWVQQNAMLWRDHHNFIRENRGE